MNGYEIVSGHRRKKACEIAGLATVPAEIKDLTRDEAILLMVDSMQYSANEQTTDLRKGEIRNERIQSNLYAAEYL